MEGKTKGILVAVVKWRHRANDLLQSVLKLTVCSFYLQLSINTWNATNHRGMFLTVSKLIYIWYIRNFVRNESILLGVRWFVYFSPYFPSPSTYKKENLTPQAFVLLFLQPILGDPGGVSRAGLKGATKSFQPVPENFCRAFSPGPTDRPWVSEDAYS